MSVIGDLGSEEDSATRLVLVAGSYGAGADGLVRPLPGPVWTSLGDDFAGAGHCWALDLRSGVLTATPVGDGIGTVRFVSLVRPRDRVPSGRARWTGVVARPAVRTPSAGIAPCQLRVARGTRWLRCMGGNDLGPGDGGRHRLRTHVVVARGRWSRADRRRSRRRGRAPSRRRAVVGRRLRHRVRPAVARAPGRLGRAVGRRRHRDRRRPRCPARRPLRPVPPAVERVDLRRGRGRGTRPHRPRLRRPCLLGHRRVRAPGTGRRPPRPRLAPCSSTGSGACRPLAGSPPTSAFPAHGSRGSRPRRGST